MSETPYDAYCHHGREIACLECLAEEREERRTIELPEKHPLRLRAEAAEAQRNLLRAALVALVGVDGREQLEAMEGVMRLMPAPAQDKAATIDAIHALIATLSTGTPAPARETS